MSAFDKALSQHIPPELRDQLPKAPRRGPAPDLDPTPLEERDQAPSQAVLERNLIQAHARWDAASRPDGPEAGELIRALSEAYLHSEDGSHFEQDVVSFAQSIQALDVLEVVTEAHNDRIEREEMRTAQTAVALEVFRNVPQAQMDKMSFDAGFLRGVRDGTLSLDEIKAELAVQIEATAEIDRSQTRREELTKLDEGLLRETPGEAIQAEYRDELSATTERQARPSIERIDRAVEKRLDLPDSRAAAELAEFDAQLAKHSPSEMQLAMEAQASAAAAEEAKP